MLAYANGIIRTADVDDAPFLHELYALQAPRAALLTQKREPLMPTLDEVRELLQRQKPEEAAFYAVEDLEGQVLGFCGLRGTHHEYSYSEFTCLAREEAAVAHSAFEDALAFAVARAFKRLRLNKLLAQALGREQDLRVFLERHGFAPNGIQRQVLYSGGAWHDIHSYSLYRNEALQEHAKL